MLSDSEISKLGEVQVWKGSYYDSFKKPIHGGLLDPRMVPFNPLLHILFWILFNVDACACFFFSFLYFLDFDVIIMLH